mmetsp:Transcript_85910/g.161778  ORF Transcript_85910/g.161778 Transcript_85910/m.161778 type:complete len:277 (+) Transcript_85910:122-952(+)
MWDVSEAAEFRWGYRWWGLRTGPRVPWHSADRILPAIDCGPDAAGVHSLRGITPQRGVGDISEGVMSSTSPLSLPAPSSSVDLIPKFQVSPRRQEQERERRRFNKIIETCGRRKMWNQALKVPGEMREFGLNPDETTYNKVIQACTSADRLDMALGVLEEMAQLGFVPDLATFGELMAACQKLEQWETALRLLVVMRQTGQPLDAGIYGEVVGACWRGQQYGIVLKLLEEMRQDRVAPEIINFWRERLAKTVRASPWKHWEQFRARQEPLPHAGIL